jgi:hypothetical protein
VLKPYVADKILKFSVRYQASVGFSTNPNPVSITRAFILNLKFLNQASSTNSYRLFSAVRLNQIEMVVAAAGSVEWLSNYSPTSVTEFNATSTTAAGIYTTSPPMNSLASFWSTSGSNESEVLLKIVNASANDYLTAWYSVVITDNVPQVAVTTAGAGIGGRVYTSAFDGPASAAQWVPVSNAFLN